MALTAITTNAIHVSTLGSSGGSGGILDPVDDVADALSLAAAQGKGFVLIAEGSYTAELELVEGITLIGSMTEDFLSYDPVLTPTIINGSSSAPTILAENINSSTLVQGLTIVSSTDGAAGSSSIAVLIRDSNDSLAFQ